MAKPSEVEGQLRSAGRLALWALIALMALVALGLGLTTNGPHRPAVVPCPPSECTFHPHAPHGPGPGMKVTP